ncbi:hypothetical protein B0H16DRAFT_1753004 [Mycena metata]|uniref:Endonuclease/exonuclease/phosphatase domain-containing protein n=1 Tax=Mycena metata TaxID=1033252 RepID=A0AAD7GD42_9AGAR|nr:hypothetical protein B0H16DRAFT_1753004 [Mycena metata]
MPPRTNTPALPAADAGRPRTCAATGSTRNTPTGSNARLPASCPTSAAIPADTPQVSPTKTSVTAAQPATTATDGGTATSPFLQPVGTTGAAPPRIPGHYGPPPSAAGSAIDLVSLTAPAASLVETPAPDDRSTVRSPKLTSVPLASLVARAADAFDAGADISTATVALTIDTTNLAAPLDGAGGGNFPPLPPPGEEVMDRDAAAARRAAKNKAPQAQEDEDDAGRKQAIARRIREAASPADAPDTVLSPLDITARSIAHVGTTLDDENLDGFFDENVRPDPHVLAELERVVAESENLPPGPLLLATEQEQRDLERARQASLGIVNPPTHGTLLSARRPEGGSGSPPKKTCTDAPIRVTRASSTAAAQAAAAAIAAATAPPAAAAQAAPQAGAAPPAGAPAPVNAPAPVLAPVPQHPQPAVPVANPRTYDGQAPRVFVTQGQFPETTADAAARVRNVDPGQITTWYNTPGTILGVISGGSMDPAGESQDGIRMGAANPANPRLPTPNVFGITGIPPDIAVFLLNDRVLSVKQITLFLYALVPDSFSGFLGNVEGLTFPNTPAGAQEAANMITNTLSTTPAFFQLVMNHRDNLPAHWTIQQALTAILGSITISPIELLSPRGPRVVWRVYMMVTANDPVAYNAIRAAFTPILFVTAFNNTGRVRADMFCRICKSIDHPTPLCPFPDVPGWMGPTPASLAAAPIATRGGRGRGNGRGRARGGRVLAVYAPAGSPAENKAFWEELHRLWMTEDLPVPDVMLGDMNIVEDTIDRLPHRADDASAAHALADLKRILEIKDGWRMTYPDTKQYTFSRGTGSHSRIDRIYLTDTVQELQVLEYQ